MGTPYVTVFDVESTGVDVENDRIVTATVGTLDREGNWVWKGEWLIDPGVEIPQGAIDVHGITNERVACDGLDPSDAIRAIAWEIRGLNLPVVIYNAPYDTTILDRELRRYGHAPIEWPKVLDPYVLDKAFDKWRKGSRKLVDTAAHYGIQVDEASAHDSSYDCWLAGNIAIRLRDKMYRESGKQDFWPFIMRYQAAQKAEQAASLEKYLRKSDDTIRVSPEWPLQAWRGESSMES